MIYVVLGMHKSGTTLVSQILHNSGIDMVEIADKDVTYDDGNKYERQSVLALNMEILGVEDYEVRALPQPENLELTAGQRSNMRHIISNCNAKFSDWGFKDPRSAYTYPLWRQELPEHKIIVIHRPPDEIWPRFRWRGLRKRYLNPLWAWQFLLRWTEHNQSILDYMQDKDARYLLLDYREMMTSDTEIKRLETFIGKPIKDMRRRDLYRTKKPRKDICLALAAWLMRHVKVQSVEVVMEKLSALRAEQCASGKH